MRHNRLISIVSLVLLLATSMIFPGCDGKPSDPINFSNYRISGLIVIDENLGQRTSAFALERNDSILTDGFLFADTTAIPYRTTSLGFDSLYTLVESGAKAQLGSLTELTLVDPAGSIETSILVTDSFSITNLVPANHLIRGLDVVTLEWSASVSAETYVMAAVKADSVYQGSGFGLYATSFNTAGTIPAAAFIGDDGVNPDTGLYNIYVYSIAGSPDSALAHNLLPTPLPSQLSDSIVTSNLTTKFGSVHVLLLDTVRVTFIVSTPDPPPTDRRAK